MSKKNQESQKEKKEAKDECVICGGEIIDVINH